MTHMSMAAAERNFQNPEVEEDYGDDPLCSNCGELDVDGDFAEFAVEHSHESIWLCPDCADTHRDENYPTGEVL